MASSQLAAVRAQLVAAEERAVAAEERAVAAEQRALAAEARAEAAEARAEAAEKKWREKVALIVSNPTNGGGTPGPSRRGGGPRPDEFGRPASYKLGDYSFFPRITEAGTEVGFVRYARTHVEIGRHLYQGNYLTDSGQKGAELSFVTADNKEDADELYGQISKHSDIKEMVSLRLPTLYFENIRRHMVGIEPVTSLERWLIREREKFKACGKGNWVSYIQDDLKSIFRQVIGGINAFMNNQLLPLNLEVAIFLDSFKRVKLIPSRNKTTADSMTLIRRQLRTALSRILFPDDTRYADNLTLGRCDLLPLELGFFGKNLIEDRRWGHVDNKFLLSYPFFWTNKERADFIRGLYDLVKGQRLPQDFWSHFFFKGRRPNKKVAITEACWIHDIPENSTLSRVLDSTSGGYSRRADIIRYTNNVLRHYIENSIENSIEKDFYYSVDEVMGELMKVFPYLYISIYETIEEGMWFALFKPFRQYESAITSLIPTITF